LHRNASNFTSSHIDLKNFPGRETRPGPLLTGAGKGKEGGKKENGRRIKGSYL